MKGEYEPSSWRGCLTVIAFPIALVVSFLFDNKPLGIIISLAGILIVVALVMIRSGDAVAADVAELLRSQFGNGETKPTIAGSVDDNLKNTPSNERSADSLIGLTTNIADYWKRPRVYTLKLPKETKWNSANALTMFTKLIHLGGLVLRIVGTADQIVWQLIDVNEQPNTVDEIERALRAAYIDAEVGEPELLESIEVKEGFWRRIDFYHQTQEFLRPSLRASDISKDDPLTAIVNSLVNLQGGERVSYLLGFSVPSDTKAIEELSEVGRLEITTSKTAAVVRDALVEAAQQKSFGDAFWMAAGTGIGGALRSGRPAKFAPDIMKVCVEKYQDFPPVRCFVMVEADSYSQERLAQFNFFATFIQHFSTEYQKLSISEEVFHITNQQEEKRSNSIWQLTHLLQTYLVPVDRRANVFVTSEMAALWHLPHEAMTAAEIAWLKGKQVAAPVEFRGERAGVQLGINKPTKAVIYQPLRERIVHTLIIGKTGTGKTSLMHGMIAHDIQAGNGVAVIDPAGNLVRRILQHSIPKEREDDVVVLDIDFEFQKNGALVRYPPPMNLTSMPEGVERSQVAFQFASVLGKLYSEIEQSRWMQTLEAALLTVAADDTPTLMDVRRVIQDASYRNQLLAKLDFSVTQMWEDIEISGGLDKTSIGSIIWRLGRFTSNPTLQAVTCHPKPLNLADLIGKNKIILVSVSADESKVPESARNVLGAIILSQIQMAVLGGAVKDPKNKPFMLYVDEVQNFVSSSLDVIARQARQKGLGLVVTTQYTKSIAPKTLKALEGNIGTLVAFECDMDDAESAISLMPSFTAKDLVNVGRFKAAISMRSADSANRASFSIDPVSAPDVSGDLGSLERELYLREKSVATYTPMTYDEVKSWLVARNGLQQTQAKNEDDDAEFGNPLTT